MPWGMGWRTEYQLWIAEHGLCWAFTMGCQASQSLLEPGQLEARGLNQISLDDLSCSNSKSWLPPQPPAGAENHFFSESKLIRIVSWKFIPETLKKWSLHLRLTVKPEDLKSNPTFSISYLCDFRIISWSGKTSVSWCRKWVIIAIVKSYLMTFLLAQW